jgi:transcriptional regulator with XRE-family HTH domain
MARTGVTQADLARFLEITQPQIHKYLAGKVDIPLARSIKLSLITDIPVEKLLKGPDASRLLELLGNRERSAHENVN